jgi:Arc/MetJ-type ribon-helix-helix transcriptional regulator
MQITLPSDVEAAVRTRVDSGAFASPEDVVRAALVALQQHEQFGDFAPGELDGLLAEGEASIAKEGTLDGDEAFEARRARRAARSGG